MEEGEGRKVRKGGERKTVSLRVGLGWRKWSESSEKTVENRKIEER
jgi:hypothetical protein